MKKYVITVLLLIFLYACKQNQIQLKENNMTVELGSLVDMEVGHYFDNIDEKTISKVEMKIYQQDQLVNIENYNQVGDYILHFKYHDKEWKMNIKVEDTTKPVFTKFEDQINIYKDEEIKINSLFEASDYAEVQIQLDESKIDHHKVGKYKTTVMAIDANSNKETKEIVVQVKEPQLQLSKKQLTMIVNESQILKTKVEGKSKSVKYSSSNPNIAVISDIGKITAKNAGKTTIIVTANGVSQKCEVTVKEKQVSQQETKPSTPQSTQDSYDKNIIDTRMISHLKTSSSTNQIIVVSTNNAKTKNCTIQYFEKNGSNWNEVFNVSGVLGEKGINKTKEGDKKTPTGLFHFTSTMGMGNNPGTILPYHQIDDNDYWCGETYYNCLVDEDKQEHNCSKQNDEKLSQYRTPYQYVAVLDYNSQCIFGKGSGIFLHCMPSSKKTLGCIAIEKSKMLYLMKKITKNTIIIIDLKSNIYKY